jgi:nicotinate phosphoribosyltransferase
MLIQIFKEGQLVYNTPSIHEIKAYREEALSKIWSEVKRLENPQQYYVDYSQKLYDLKVHMMEKYQK